METTCILNPERGKADPRLPTTGILAVNPSDTQSLAEYADRAGLKRSFLFNSILFHSDALFLAGPAVGAPMAVLCLEKLIALGAEKIILYGWCGSLQKKLHGMDILVPTSGMSEEGTSRHYQSDRNCEIIPSATLRNELCRVLTDKLVEFQQGPLWTTDAPYRETKEKITDYAAQGIYGVDMEYSALCTVAAFRKAQLAAVMLVSDELLKSPWKPHYSFKAFKKRSRELLALLCDAARLDNIF
ncbi:MAG: nucleoside phosphorylase [Thermodesulfobacteriota bacterium]|nr:nucleoside phosphorylase [Thermodesulfobacteriota bacterium]